MVIYHSPYSIIDDELKSDSPELSDRSSSPGNEGVAGADPSETDETDDAMVDEGEYELYTE